MPKHVTMAVVVFVLSTAFIVGGRFGMDAWQERERKTASDFGTVDRTYRLAVDSWIGYAPLCGDEMARRLALRGIGLDCVDDQADYITRFERVRNTDYDIAVTTIDAYLREYHERDAPGPIVAIIDESAGGDAIVGKKQVATDLEALKNPDSRIRIAFTPASPSEFLMMAIGQHFDLPFNERNLYKKIETDGSGEALSYIEAGRADLAVLWEPDVSRALEMDGVIKLIGSEDTAGLIVDVLIASREMVTKHEDDLSIILATFFETLDYYDSNHQRRNTDLAVRLGVDESEIDDLVSGVRWTLLLENGTKWFDAGPDGWGEKRLVRTLHSTNEVLDRAGLTRTPSLPAGAVLRMVWSDSIEKLYLDAFADSDVSLRDSSRFKELTAAEWTALKPIGALQIDSITFQPGTSLLTQFSRDELDRVADVLNFYPRYRLLVRGHTSNAGDASANLSLSRNRAAAVADYLQHAHSVDVNRVRAEGMGGSQPLARGNGESLRAWRYRLPRVELKFLGERR